MSPEDALQGSAGGDPKLLCAGKEGGVGTGRDVQLFEAALVFLQLRNLFYFHRWEGREQRAAAAAVEQRWGLRGALIMGGGGGGINCLRAARPGRPPMERMGGVQLKEGYLGRL